MQKTESSYCGAVVIGFGVVMPHPKQPDMFVLPGGTICDRQTAEAASYSANTEPPKASEVSHALQKAHHPTWVDPRRSY